MPGDDRGACGPPPNLYDVDLNLQFEVRHRVEPKDRRRAELWLRELGRVAGDELDRLAAQAEAHPPRLIQFDREGNRIDRVEYHPAYRAMEEIAFARFAFAAMSHRPGLLGWPTPVPHVIKYLLSYIFVQSEFGIFCPVSMTDSAARVLRMYGSEQLKRRYLPRLTSTDLRSLWQAAMFMTERQGGSDVGATTSTARRDGGEWRLYGEKWFCSNVDAEVILTLARPEGGAAGTAGLGLFLVPRFLPDGRPNELRINRLKDKLGSRSMATGEVTLQGAWAHPVGALENGFRQMTEMINVSRLSNAMRAAALMRRAFHEALSHAQARKAFGFQLIDLPLMRSNLVRLLLEVEAATAFVLYAAQALDRADAGDAHHKQLIRILTPVAKYAICRRARRVAGDAMDVRGGNGYVEEWIHPRLLRDAHLGSIWEGTSDIVALDVVRSMRRERTHEALFDELSVLLERCRRPELAPAAEELRSRLAAFSERVTPALARERRTRDPLARRVADALYRLATAALLLEEAQWELEENGSGRKLLVARLHAARRLSARDPLALDEGGVSEEQFDALVQWTALRVSAALA